MSGAAMMLKGPVGVVIVMVVVLTSRRRFYEASERSSARELLVYVGFAVFVAVGIETNWRFGASSFGITTCNGRRDRPRTWRRIRFVYTRCAG